MIMNKERTTAYVIYEDGQLEPVEWRLLYDEALDLPLPQTGGIGRIAGILIPSEA